MSYRGPDDVFFLLESITWLLNLSLIALGFFVAAIAVAWYG
jgi:hypothetical protein